MIGDDEDPEDDPNIPGHPDYDLSEAAGYGGWEPLSKPWYVRRWLMLLVAIIVISAMVLPLVRQFGS